jgi:hypothetical protein
MQIELTPSASDDLDVGSLKMRHLIAILNNTTRKVGTIWNISFAPNGYLIAIRATLTILLSSATAPDPPDPQLH